MKRLFYYILLFTCLSILMTGCKSDVTMPYSTEEYKHLGWTVETAYEHFVELGFSNIEIDIYSTDEIEISGLRIFVETDHDTWFREIEKGEIIDSESTIHIKMGNYTPVWTVENCPEFAKIISLDRESPEWDELWSSFAKTHNGEYLEFDGIITDWYDELWFAGGVSFTVSVNDSKTDFYSWSCIDLIDLDLTGDYHYTKYHIGLISEGQRIYMKTKIICDGDQIQLNIESFELR